MYTEKADLNPTPAKTDLAQTNESVENSKSENREEKDPSYMRSRQMRFRSKIEGGIKRFSARSATEKRVVPQFM